MASLTDITNKLKRNAYSKEYRETHREAIRNNEKRYLTKYKKEHPEEFKAKAKAYLLKIKTEVMKHYGNGEAACLRCGYNDIRALNIDHVNGGGKNDRKSHKRHGGYSFYLKLRKLGYPSGYQTLCANCNLIKKIENNEY